MINTYKLRDISKKITKGTTPSKKEGGFCKIGINYIKAESVDYHGLIDDSKFVFISEDVHKRLKRSQLEENDILFSMAGTFLGKTGFVELQHLPANINQALALIRIDSSKAVPKFVHYYLQQKKVVHFVNTTVSQSAQPNINLIQIGDLDIRLPSLAKQARIVSILMAFDNKLKLYRHINQTLDKLAQTLFKSWFIDFDPVIDNALRAGNPIPKELRVQAEHRKNTVAPKSWQSNHQFDSSLNQTTEEYSSKEAVYNSQISKLFPDSLKKTEWGWVPDNWSVKPISNHCINIHNGRTPDRTTPEYWMNGNIPWLTSGELHQRVITTTERCITFEGQSQSGAKWIPEYSTLVALYGATAGKVAITKIKTTTNQAICSLIPLKGYELYNFMAIRQKAKEMKNKAAGSAQQNINKKIVEMLRVISPSLPVITEFSRLTSIWINKISENSIQSSTLRILRKELLNKLISGDCIPDNTAKRLKKINNQSLQSIDQSKSIFDFRYESEE